MQFHRVDHLSFLSPLIQHYLKGDLPQASSYLPNWKGIEAALSNKSVSKQHRDWLADQWSKQYDADHQRQALINKLRDSSSFTVTTGHQLALATGPAFMIYKIASTIALAKLCAAKFPDSSFIPVFWMASEDHDFEEISTCYTRNGALTWKVDHGGPVGRLSTEGIHNLLGSWLDWLSQSGKSDITTLLSAAYQQKNLSSATRHLIDGLFKDHELLIIDADQSELKSKFVPVMEREIKQGFVQKAMAFSSEWLSERGWKHQVQPREINVFYQTDEQRKRIVREGEQWRALDLDVVWNETELADAMQRNPERFSPNVTLRPLYQEVILPNVAYVGGPGELAYWLQLKPVFEAQQVDMPVVLLRDSATAIAPNMANKWKKWGSDTALFTSTLNNELVKLVQTYPIDFDTTAKSIADAMKALANALADIEPSLETAAAIEHKKQIEGLQNLEKKVKKAIKLKEENRVIQLQKFYEELYPQGEPQERHFNFLDLNAALRQDILALCIALFNPLSPQMTIFIDVDPDTTAAE